jgi:membrane protease YdiL (CAAX protease family)
MPRITRDRVMGTLVAAPAGNDRKRSAPVRQALLFLLVCSPLWLVPGLVSVAHPAVMLAIVVGITLLFLRWDGRSPSVLGLDPAWRRAGELAAGFGGGALLIGVVALCVSVILPFPWLVNPRFDLGAAGFSLLWLLCGNAVEELIFRGYGFERLIAGIGIWKAQLVTALLFAGFHIVNGWPWQVALIGTTAGSLLFGMVFIRWRSVPAAVGVHAAGNWVRDLLLVDPPTAKTLFAPLSPRPWTPGEQISTGAILIGMTLLACAALWMSILHRRSDAV